MKIIEKNILTVEKGIICQSVNCQGVMGSGLAKSIREKWPIVYDNYRAYCESGRDFELIGDIQLLYLDQKLPLILCNVFGQLNYGYDGKSYTEYAALRMAFQDLSEFQRQQWPDLDIYFPFQMGAGLGGGNWDIIKNMIEYYFPNAIVCKLP